MMEKITRRTATKLGITVRVERLPSGHPYNYRASAQHPSLSLRPESFTVTKAAAQSRAMWCATELATQLLSR